MICYDIICHDMICYVMIFFWPGRGRGPAPAGAGRGGRARAGPAPGPGRAGPRPGRGPAKKMSKNVPLFLFFAALYNQKGTFLTIFSFLLRFTKK